MRNLRGQFQSETPCKVVFKGWDVNQEIAIFDRLFQQAAPVEFRIATTEMATMLSQPHDYAVEAVELEAYGKVLGLDEEQLEKFLLALNEPTRCWEVSPNIQ